MEVKGYLKRNRWHFCENIGNVWNGVRPALQCLDITCLCKLSFLLKDFSQTEQRQLMLTPQEQNVDWENVSIMRTDIVLKAIQFNSFPPPPPLSYCFPSTTTTTTTTTTFLLFSLHHHHRHHFPIVFPPPPPPPLPPHFYCFPSTTPATTFLLFPLHHRHHRHHRHHISIVFPLPPPHCFSPRQSIKDCKLQW